MEEIFKTMQDLIAEQFAIDADEISMDSSFVDDLGADSVDLVELVMAMEEEFQNMVYPLQNGAGHDGWEAQCGR